MNSPQTPDTGDALPPRTEKKAMNTIYSVENYRKLEKAFYRTALHRPMHMERYEVGTELVYEVTSSAGAGRGRVELVIEKFVGGGFAGQVYQVKLMDISPENDPISGLESGGVYAMKILIPPSGFSVLFR